MTYFYSSKSIPKILLLVILIIMICQLNVNAQTIKVVPNPDPGNKKGSSYIVYNNQLYTGYTDAENKIHLARWNGSGLTVIPNPDNGTGFADFPIVFNNKLCFRYLNQSKKYQLAQYDGSSIALVSNPDNGTGFNGDQLLQPAPTIFKGKLYIQYLTLTAYNLAAFDGSNLQIVTTKDSLQDYVGAPIIYNSEFYSVWVTKNQTGQLVAYDGTTFTIIPNPTDGTFLGQGLNFDNSTIVQYPHPTVYNGKLYLTYHDNTNQTINYVFQLAQYDGSNTVLIPNPTNDGGFGVYYNDPVIYNNKLYVTYNDTISIQSSGEIGSTDYLGEFDGQKLRVIPNPDSSYSIIGIDYSRTNYITYNNKLYFATLDSRDRRDLTSFNGINDSLIRTTINNDIDETMPIVYRNKLFFALESLTQYDGQSISTVSDPNGGGYSQYPFVFNDTLFFVYNSSTIYHLAYLDYGTLAVNYLKLSVQNQSKNVVLNWETANETNTSYFNIQRSSDGIHFITLNKVVAKGNSTNVNDYGYTDANVTALNVTKLYYRLQEVDKDGTSTYSSIQTVDFSKAHLLFSVSPNPSKDFINIVSLGNVSNAQVKVTNMDGKTLYETKQNFVTGQLLRISLSQFSKQVLIVTIVSDNNHEQFKVIKE